MIIKALNCVIRVVSSLAIFKFVAFMNTHVCLSKLLYPEQMALLTRSDIASVLFALPCRGCKYLTREQLNLNSLPTSHQLS